MKPAKASLLLLASVSTAMLVQTTYTVGAPAISAEAASVRADETVRLAYLKAEASQYVVNIDGP